MRNAKSRPKTRLDKRINSWQGWEVGNQTFDKEFEKVDVHEIRELLGDMPEQPT
jgi:hypothetical protein